MAAAIIVIFATLVGGWVWITNNSTRPYLFKVPANALPNNIQTYIIHNPGPGDVEDVNVIFEFSEEVDRDDYKIFSPPEIAEDKSLRDLRKMVYKPIRGGKKLLKDKTHYLTFRSTLKSKKPSVLPQKANIVWSNNKAVATSQLRARKINWLLITGAVIVWIFAVFVGVWSFRVNDRYRKALWLEKEYLRKQLNIVMNNPEYLLGTIAKTEPEPEYEDQIKKTVEKIEQIIQQRKQNKKPR